MAEKDVSLQHRRKEAAKMIAEAAKRNAAFSRRIPAATIVREYADYTEVVTRGALAPNAAPFEKPLSHPLFGDKEHWYAQPHRPFMQDALDQKGDKAADIIGGVVVDWAEEAGFHEE